MYIFYFVYCPFVSCTFCLKFCLARLIASRLWSAMFWHFPYKIILLFHLAWYVLKLHWQCLAQSPVSLSYIVLAALIRIFRWILIVFSRFCHTGACVIVISPATLMLISMGLSLRMTSKAIYLYSFLFNHYFIIGESKQLKEISYWRII